MADGNGKKKWCVSTYMRLDDIKGGESQLRTEGEDKLTLMHLSTPISIEI